MTRTATFQLRLCAACLAFAGCSFYARSPDDYRTAMRGALEQKRPELDACYKRCVAADPKAQGTVTAKFAVEPKTGQLQSPSVVSDATNAPPALQQCVLASLSGVKLDPPDERQGEGTFTWEFAH